jgi:hypothetical protein
MIRFLLLFQLTSFLYGQKIFEEFEKDRNNKYHYKETYRFDTVPDDGSYTLLLENIEGDIQVSTHSGSGAEFTITRKIRSTTEKKAKQLVKSSTILVYHLQDDQLIQIKTKKKMRYKRDLETEFDLKLPMNINLNLETSGGNIAVIDIRGESILTTSGGDMKLKNMMGRIEARTSGGDIEVSGTEGLIRVHTSGGDIAIENSDGHFNSSTSGGDIAAEDISSNLTAMTSGGEIDLDNIKGHVDVTTSDGDIDARQITGSLNCHTSGGDIDADDIIGTVNASTTNGDIEMELSYDSSIKEYSFNLDTRSGDIFIRVPTGLPVNINAEIFGTSTAQELNSDIPLTISSTENRVTGIGKIQNGTIPLHLRASLGTITIKQD